MMFSCFCRKAASFNKPLKCVPATKSVVSTGVNAARCLAGRYVRSQSNEHE